MLLVCAGVVPYILWNQRVAFLQPVAALLPAPLPAGGGWFQQFMRCHFADMVWYYALLTAQDAVPRAYRIRILTISGCLLPFLLETLQKLHLISGTFDSLDILVYIIILLTYISYQQWIKKRNC